MNEHSFDMTASPWVRRFLPLIPKDQGPVLDLACGNGRHSRLLLDAGYDVWSLDKDAALLAPLESLGARCFQFDLEAKNHASNDAGKVHWPFDANTFSAIIVTNYLYRPLLSTLTSSLEERGILIYETFAAGNEVFGRPKNPDFLLAPGELIQQFFSQSNAQMRKNHCIAYEHGQINYPKRAVVQRICLRSVSVVSALDTSRDQLESI